MRKVIVFPRRQTVFFKFFFFKSRWVNLVSTVFSCFESAAELVFFNISAQKKLVEAKLK